MTKRYIPRSLPRHDTLLKAEHDEIVARKGRPFTQDPIGFISIEVKSSVEADK